MTRDENVSTAFTDTEERKARALSLVHKAALERRIADVRFKELARDANRIGVSYEAMGRAAGTTGTAVKRLIERYENGQGLR